MSEPASAFEVGLAALGAAGVDFVLVGVGGINFYARDPAHAFATLDVSGTEIPVGRLDKLLRSKQLSGRPKDIAFLRSFEAHAEEEEV